MSTVEEIRKLLSEGGLRPNMDDAFATGTLVDGDSKAHTYTVHYGWDIAKCLACDDLWHKFNFQLMQWINDQQLVPAALAEVLEQVQIDDGHWRWFDKALLYQGQQYHWFFMMVDGEPQAACLIYHPQKSALVDKDVFYIEYIAAAPWNRANPMSPRTFKGVGVQMIKSIMDFGASKLRFNRGFALHALPRAVEFYKKIGMLGVAAHDKGTLGYFEMTEETAISFLGAV